MAAILQPDIFKSTQAVVWSHVDLFIDTYNRHPASMSYFLFWDMI